MTLELPESGDCIFCAIVAGEAEARWEARPDGRAGDGGSRVACFHNQLKWASVMLLVVPVQHMTQREFWTSDVLVDAAALAVEMGDKHCGDDGYRVISNFGRVAHQSQAHAHMHVVSGTSDQIDEATRNPRNARVGADGGVDVAALSNGNLVAEEYGVDEVPLAMKISPSALLPVSQREFWGSEQIILASQAALEIGSRYSPQGFRLISSFEPAGNADNAAGLFLLGGGQLSLYI